MGNGFGEKAPPPVEEDDSTQASDSSTDDDEDASEDDLKTATADGPVSRDADDSTLADEESTENYYRDDDDDDDDDDDFTLTDEESIDEDADLIPPTLLRGAQSNISRASSKLGTGVKMMAEDVEDLAWHMIAGGEDTVFMGILSETFGSSETAEEGRIGHVIIDFDPFDFEDEPIPERVK